MQDDQFERLAAQQFIESRRVLHPLAMSGMTSIPKRTVDELDVVLLARQYRNGDALMICQTGYPGWSAVACTGLLL